MNHSTSILESFLKVAIEQDWWKKLTPQQQRDYLRQHRKTKLRPIQNQY
jgi:myo-inositol catabolism protein IolC